MKATNSSPSPVQLSNGKWEAVLTRNNEKAFVYCDTLAHAEAIGDAGPIMDLFDAGVKCSRERVDRCMAALWRYDYQNYSIELFEAKKLAESGEPV